jgi:arylsulfatase A-like enzyme
MRLRVFARKSTLVFAGFIAFAMLAATAQGREQTRAGAKPNIVVVITDDQGWGDLGLHGNEHIKTPYLDGFGIEAIRFTRFYVSPVCAPTRAALMTGRYYYRTGVIHTSRGAAKMHGDEFTIAEALSGAGYRTGIFGKWHLGDNYPMRPQDQGFGEVLVHKSGGIVQPPDLPNSYFEPVLWHNGKRVQRKGYCTDVFFDAAMDFIEANRKRPFFVWVALNAPHTPLEVSEHYAAPYRAMGLNDTTARVYGMVQNIDDNFGRLVSKLEALKLRENTLLIFLTDNGPQQPRFNGELRGRKTGTYEGGIRVPFFVQWPARWEGGRTVDRISADIDLFPTLLEVSGAKLPSNRALDGISLVPLLAGTARAEDWPERALFFQCHRGMTPKRYQNSAVVTQRYKLVGYPGTFNQHDFAPSASQPVLELYDLATDPSEQNDLAASKAPVLAELRARYDGWFESVKRERNFEPGIVRIGSRHENPSHLCVWQDANWTGEKPEGWSVHIERGGRYELTVKRGQFTGPGRLVAVWQGKTMAQPVSETESGAVFPLSAGKGILDVWLEVEGRGRIAPQGHDLAGDVVIRRL